MNLILQSRHINSASGFVTLFGRLNLIFTYLARTMMNQGCEQVQTHVASAMLFSFPAIDKVNHVGGGSASEKCSVT